jgi:Na+-driven multidrug efflux pump
MATDSPKSTLVHFILGGSVGFLIVFFPSVLLPFFSIKEVNKYTENRRLTLNIINSIIVFVLIFFPLAIVQFYFIYKIREE